MSVNYATYHLENGYIHNWLVAGPQVIPVPDLALFPGKDFKQQIMRQYHEERSGIGQLPREHESFTRDGVELSWDYVRCLDDHLVDLSALYSSCHYLRAWAYARLVSPVSQDVTLILTTHGPADLWLNKWHVHRHEHFYQHTPHSVSFSATLDQGHNEILVRFEQVALRACPYTMGLQVVGFVPGADADAVQVLLPTTIENVNRRQKLERLFQAAYLKREVYTEDDSIFVHWPPKLEVADDVSVRLETPAGRIYADSQKYIAPEGKVGLTRASQVPEGPYQVRIMPKRLEYYDDQMRIERETRLWVIGKHYSQTPYGTYRERRLEALRDAARRKGELYAEIAKMALDRWSQVQTDVIMQALARINRRQDGSHLELLGLLGMCHRYANHAAFPAALKTPLEESVLNFRYWRDEPGSDALCFTPEHHQIVFHACEILAGQLYPDRTFPNSGQTGQWHRQKGERLSISWLRERSTGGFQAWDANVDLQDHIAALSHLVDLAEAPQVWELAAILLDKLFFSLALNSFRGVFGSTHGRTLAPFVKGGWLEPTAGVSRLMWGMGVFNHHLRGTVSLACAGEYELPLIIHDIAAHLPEEMWNRERHAGQDGGTGTWEINKVTYKTPDYMLCSAQDYRPGESGRQEHIWQATLGPDAVVFVTHPACSSESEARHPSFWHGNAVLPRVAQWKDVLIAIHKLPENDWMGFTHAYFPAYAFDAMVLRDGPTGLAWAFARHGQGYLALTAAQGLELVTGGDNAYRELRSYGPHNTWLCHMGRAALDGAFGAFQDKILALDVTVEGLSVRCETLRGETLVFGWEGPLLRDGTEQPITGFKHYENPYCVADLPAKELEIRYGDQAMRLDFTQ